MKRDYDVDFEWTSPHFTTITVQAESEEEAELLADKQFDQEYPEAEEKYMLGAVEVN